MSEELFYKKSGSGPVLILFHGFGQDHQIFSEWVSILASTHTIYSFDLPFHGNSHRENRSLTKSEWKSIFGKFLENERIDSFSLGAFSLGGRFAIVTTILFESHVKKMILVAPDGLYKSPWFLLATSRIGNPLFKYLMLHPERFNQLLKFIEQIGFMSSATIRFAQKELKQKENRKRVYRSWTYLKKLQTHPSTLVKCVNKNKIGVHIILGEFDPIIPISGVLPKLEGINKLQRSILPHKHHQLIHGSRDLVASSLKEENL